MEDKFEYKVQKTPKGLLANMQVARLGKILFNLQFLALAVMAASLLSVIIYVLFYTLLLAVTILSLGSVFANPQFGELWSGGEAMSEVIVVLGQSWQYSAPAAAALAVASIVCLSIDKSEKHPARIVFSCLVLATAIIVFIVKHVIGMVAA